MAAQPNKLNDFDFKALNPFYQVNGIYPKGISFLLLGVWLFLINPLFCQVKPDTLPPLPSKFSVKSLQGIEKELNETYKKLDKKQEGAIKEIVNQQRNIVNKIKNTDSAFALHLFQKWESDIEQLNHASGPYIARLDTLTSFLKYIGNGQVELKQIESLDKLIIKIKDKVAIGNGFQNAVTQQQQLIEEWIGNHRLFYEGFLSQLKVYKLELIGYKQKVEDMKASLNEPAKIERAVIDGLQKIPAFNRFLEKNSQLAAILGRNGNGGSSMQGGGIPIPGMQSRQTVLQQLQQRFGNNAQGAGTVPQVMQQRVEVAMQSIGNIQQGIEKIENSIEGASIGNQSITPQEKEKASFKAMPGRKKLKFGYNLQTGGGANYFPAINDIGLKAGFQLIPRFEAGIGLAYKLGLGESWQKIKLSHEGLALRTFVDWRITPAGDAFLKGFWLTAGYERNYWDNVVVPVSVAGNSTSAPNTISQWTHTGVAGVTKKIAKGKKELQFQLLWQFAVNNSPEPITPILFRWGKSF